MKFQIVDVDSHEYHEDANVVKIITEWPEIDENAEDFGRSVILDHIAEILKLQPLAVGTRIVDTPIYGCGRDDGVVWVMPGGSLKIQNGETCCPIDDVNHYIPLPFAISSYIQTIPVRLADWEIAAAEASFQPLSPSIAIQDFSSNMKQVVREFLRTHPSHVIPIANNGYSSMDDFHRVPIDTRVSSGMTLDQYRANFDTKYCSLRNTEDITCSGNIDDKNDIDMILKYLLASMTPPNSPSAALTNKVKMILGNQPAFFSAKRLQLEFSEPDWKMCCIEPFDIDIGAFPAAGSTINEMVTALLPQILEHVPRWWKMTMRCVEGPVTVVLRTRGPATNPLKSHLEISRASAAKAITHLVINEEAMNSMNLDEALGINCLVETMPEAYFVV